MREQPKSTGSASGVDVDENEDDFLSRVKAREAAARQPSAGAEPIAARPPRRRGNWVFTAALLVFVAGAAGVGYYAWQKGGDFSIGNVTVSTGNDDGRVPLVSSTNAQPMSAEAAQAVIEVAEQQGGLEARVAGMEQRLARLDLQSQAAAGNAARAEGLLIAFATRRAIERGTPLGYLEEQLKLRFGDARPNSVRTVIEGARNPVTLDQLMARLEGLAPRLANEPKDELSWAWLQREMGELFVVRRETAPSPQPARRLDRARQFIESGRIEVAVAEVRNLPGANSGDAQRWIADAERYAGIQRALELIETTAVLEPRELRDGGGNRVEQLSPVLQ